MSIENSYLYLCKVIWRITKPLQKPPMLVRISNMKYKPDIRLYILINPHSPLCIQFSNQCKKTLFLNSQWLWSYRTYQAYWQSQSFFIDHILVLNILRLKEPKLQDIFVTFMKFLKTLDMNKNHLISFLQISKQNLKLPIQLKHYFKN